MGRVRLWSAFAAAAALLLATLSLGSGTDAAAASSEVAEVRGRLEQGPVLTDRGVAWLESRCARSCAQRRYALRSWSRGRMKTLARGDLPPAVGGEPSVSFALSRDALVLRETTAAASGVRTALSVALPGGPLRTEYSCASAAGAVHFALSGDWLHYVDRCPETPGVRTRLVGRRVSDGAITVNDEQGEWRIRTLAAAGLIHAVHRDPPPGVDAVPEIGVFTASVAYKLDLPRRHELSSLDLDHEAVLALATRESGAGAGCGPGILSWHSTQDPRGPRLELPICGPVRLAGHRIVLLTGTPGRRALEAVSPDGGRQRLLSVGAARLYGYDANRDSVVLALRRCRRVVILRRPLAGRRPVPGRSCPGLPRR